MFTAVVAGGGQPGALNIASCGCPHQAKGVGIAMWFISCLTFGIGMKAMSLMPDKIFSISVAWGLVENLVAIQIGAWAYKEA